MRRRTHPMWGRPSGPARGARAFLLGACCALAAACSEPAEEVAPTEPVASAEPVAPNAAAAQADASAELTLEDVLLAPYRREDRARDDAVLVERVVKETGLRAGARIVEVWPGDGYWTRIFAPLAAHHGGAVVAAHFPASASEAGVRAARAAFLDRLAELSQAARAAVDVAAYDPAGGGFTVEGEVDAALVTDEAATAFAGAPDRARALLAHLADLTGADARILIAALGREDVRKAWSELLTAEGRRFESVRTQTGWLLIVAPAG